MQTQTFILQDPSVIGRDNLELNVELEQHQVLLESVGFGKMHAWERSGAAKLDTAGLLYPELTGKEFKMWRTFLPTVVKKFKAYQFDTPPVEALQAIQTAKQLQCFECIEIWTPEGNSFLGHVVRKLDVAKDKLRELGDRIDPMAVGVVSDLSGREHYYPIVRWGEALKPVKQIRRQVAMINWRIRLLFMVLPLLLGVMAIAFYVAGIMHFGASNMLLGTAGGVIAVVVTICMFAAMIDDF